LTEKKEGDYTTETDKGDTWLSFITRIQILGQFLDWELFLRMSVLHKLVITPREIATLVLRI